MKNSLLVVVSLFALTLGVSAARADVLVSGSYSDFTFGGVGSTASPSFTVTGSATITVLDGYLDGDQFAVYDNDVLLGDTSTPVNDGTTCTDDTAACYASLDFSRGTYAVGSGLNTISIVAILSPYGDGGAFIGENVEPLALTAVSPEPSSLVLLGTGVLGACGAVRRRLRA